MYVERETGGLGRGTIITGDGEQVWETGAARTPAGPGSKSLEKLEDRSRQDQRKSDEAPAAAVHLPTRIAKAPGQARPRSARAGKLAMLGVALLVAAGAGGNFGYRWWTVGRFIEATDDAYVSAHNTTLAAKVAGYVSAIAVEDNSRVHAGDVIATIDDGDFRLAVDAARDKVATQQATVDRIGRQIVAQQASVAQAKAQLVSAQAGNTRMRLELDRQQALAQREFASRQTLEQAQSNRDQALAGVQSAQAAVDAADANVDVLKAQQQEAAKTLEELRTALAKAERDLSFTVIRAPVDGVIGNRAVQTGDFVQTGQRLASLVPLDEVYVDANFKETQLAHLRPGQQVSITVDALPDQAIAGTVTSLAPASGAVFSLLPPDNATGNFTKIVQRLPVRVSVPLDVATLRVLRPGMSVVVSVNTKPDTNLAATRTAAAQIN
jgi:membrane fusion protein (multidrug efflux system)